MDMEMSDTQELLVETAKDIVDRFGDSYFREKRIEDEKPEEFIDAMADAGFFGIPIPEEYGGEGLGLIETVHAIETFSVGGAWFDLGGLTSNVFFTGMVNQYGTEEQKEEYLPKMANRDHTWSIGVTEPDSGTNMLQTEVFAERDGDEFVINGEKAFNSGLGSRDMYALVTRTKKYDDVERRTDGFTLFLVEDPADVEGIDLDKVDLDIYWYPEEHTYFVHLDDVRIPASQVLGEVHEGVDPIFSMVNAERISTAAAHIGRGKWALEQAVDRAKTREVWGEPIGAHQGISLPLAEAYSELETASTMVKRAAVAFDKGQDNVGELANIAHLEASKAGFNATDVAVETFGGASAMNDYGITQVWSLERHQTIAPLPENMKLNYIANNVLGLPRSYGT